MTIELTATHIETLAPYAPSPGEWAAALNPALKRFEITSAGRCAAFLAQVAHESGGFRHVLENLSYSAERLMAVWPKRFPTIASTSGYARNPQALANRVYAGRLGNGNEASGDGWRYRGRGLIQLTGRANYREAGEGIGRALEAQPELVERRDIAALTACWFWHSRGCNALADQGTESAFETITKRINGGTHGLEDRRGYWRKAKNMLALD